jgi:hypothetical protein
MGLIVTGAVSTGGLAALTVKVSRKKKEERGVVLNSSNTSNSNKENKDVNQHD